MYRYICFALALLVAYVSCGSVPAENKCPGTFRDVRISNCTAFPCTLYKGKNYTVDIDFSPFRNVEKAFIKCNTIYYGQPFEIPEQPVCDDLKPETCPLFPDRPYTYSYTFNVAHVVPATSYPIRCALVDESKTEHICLRGSGIIKE